MVEFINKKLTDNFLKEMEKEVLSKLEYSRENSIMEYMKIQEMLYGKERIEEIEKILKKDEMEKEDDLEVEDEWSEEGVVRWEDESESKNDPKEIEHKKKSKKTNKFIDDCAITDSEEENNPRTDISTENEYNFPTVNSLPLSSFYYTAPKKKTLIKLDDSDYDYNDSEVIESTESSNFFNEDSFELENIQEVEEFRETEENNYNDEIYFKK